MDQVVVGLAPVRYPNISRKFRDWIYGVLKATKEGHPEVNWNTQKYNK